MADFDWRAWEVSIAAEIAADRGTHVRMKLSTLLPGDVLIQLAETGVPDLDIQVVPDLPLFEIYYTRPMQYKIEWRARDIARGTTAGDRWSRVPTEDEVLGFIRSYGKGLSDDFVLTDRLDENGNTLWRVFIAVADVHTVRPA